MSNLSEQALNIELGNQLAEMLPSFSKIEAEKTDVIAKKPGKRPDISITSQGRSPVVIEAEFDPANNVENEAQERLKSRLKNQSLPVESVIALIYPQELRQASNLKSAIAKACLRYRALYANENPFPEHGWLEGSISDLADLIDLVAVPKSAFDKATDTLIAGIDGAVSALENSDAIYITDEIAALLGLTNAHLFHEPIADDKERELKILQTRRIACAIIANAFIFHERIAKTHKHILPIDHVCGRFVDNPKQTTLDAWENILTINYWPIFDTAHKIIHLLPAREASEILEILKNAAESIRKAGLLYEHDLTGHIFQRLIVDRKYLAAYYTLPESAALLARIAVAKMKDIDWKDKEAIGKLKIADFACGTGALLAAVYDQITARHERTGGNPETLHPLMIEQVLYGCDVMPYAVHITASTLSGKQPIRTYDNSRLYTMPYGRQEDKTVQIGSLEFLDKPEQSVLFHTGDPAKRIGSAGEEAADLLKANVPNESLDMVIMNPPFTSATNHEGAHADVVNPAFAAFGATEEDMDEMGKRLNALGKGTCYHGNAGIASAFVALADKKLKPGGILALVLPLTAAVGSSWQKIRTLLAKDYEDVEVVSLAAAKGYDTAFSADTGMADCLVVGRKRKNGKTPNSQTRFISLLRRPAGFVASAEIAKQLASAKTIRNLEDGPFGGDEVFCGQEKMGETIQANIQKTNPVWNAARIQDFELIQTAYALTQSKLWPPRRKAKPLAITELKNVGKRGLLSRDITGPAPRGPFDKTAPSRTATYPALWSHNAKQETHLICQPDCQLRVRPGMEEKANEIWHRFAGRCHFNLNFTLGSQPLAVAFTEEDCIGGDAWPNVNFAKRKWDYAFAIWGNCTLGLLCYWWHATRQQPGRARVSITASETLPVLDFLALSQAQIQQAKAIFNGFRNKHFLPAYVADMDKTRALLDERVICDWLGFEETTYQAVRQLAAKWCAEPSVHGGKQRPSNTSLVI